MSRIIFFTLFSFAWMCSMNAQDDPEEIYVPYNGGIYSAIVENGDTLYLAELDHINVTSPRNFDSREDYILYMRYKQHAAHVYPYAMTAIRLYREIEEVSDELNRREQRRFVRRLQRQMRDEFEEPLRSMTRTQGYILVKMIERELDTPMYFLIRDLRSGLTATYWSTLSSFFGYDLREGYEFGKDDLLDLVLDDLRFTMPERFLNKNAEKKEDRSD
jgi:hypothetical protein